ncbi:MAG: phosphate ABC transporter, permease protein PstA, partial [Elusimicrobia bacterium]|nr:phosphate ABC transporter, permease protein PstA [Elusimicrobiota bacterium]
MKMKAVKQTLGFLALRLCMGFVGLILIVVFYDIITKGAPAISWEFLSQAPREGMTEGGIFPAIVGTFFVTVITAVLAVPLGMGSAIYLNEYAPENLMTRFIRMSIRNLSGVPSIVYGLFGVALFVDACRFGTSV